MITCTVTLVLTTCVITLLWVRNSHYRDYVKRKIDQLPK